MAFCRGTGASDAEVEARWGRVRAFRVFVFFGFFRAFKVFRVFRVFRVRAFTGLLGIWDGGFRFEGKGSIGIWGAGVESLGDSRVLG